MFTLSHTLLCIDKIETEEEGEEEQTTKNNNSNKKKMIDYIIQDFYFSTFLASCLACSSARSFSSCAFVLGLY